MLASRCLVFFLARTAAIRNDDDEVGQLLPQNAWWQDAFHGVSSALEARRANGTSPICGHATNMGLEGHLLHCDAQLSKIRAAFDVPDPEEILKSSNIDLAHAEESQGKSGAKMIFSDDKKYIIKTMSSRDLKALKGVIDAYASHIVGHATDSEMMRLYAIIEDPEHGMWLIGNNWLPVRFPITWDLKGSMVGRQSGAEKRAQKDKDWLAQGKALAVPPGQRNAVLQALESDSSMLARYNLIDYSLIVGVLVYDLEPCDGQGQPACISPICHPQGGCGEAGYNLGDYFAEIKDFYCAENSLKDRELGHTCVGGFTQGLKVYFQCFGIIDLLKPYDMKSKLEYGAKGGFARQVSAQPAQTYAKRFFKFMHEKVFSKELSDSTAPLIFTPKTCGSFGSRQHSSKGSNKTVVMIVGAVAVVLIIGSALAWYALRKPKAATEVGGDALQAYQPEVSHYQQGYQGYQGYPGETQGYQGEAYQSYQAYPEGYQASWTDQQAQQAQQAPPMQPQSPAWPAAG